MPDKLTAYHGDPALKDKAMAKIAAHRAADEIAKGAYVRAGIKPTYCAVGCLLEDPEGGHMRYESEFGIPAQLAYLEDGIFEALPTEQAIPWPERFMGAINVGADLSKVWPKFAIWMMVDPEWGLLKVTEAEDVKAICRRVADGYQHDLDGDPLSDEDVEALARAARAAWDARAAWAAWAARAARAAWAAWDARAARAAWAARAARAEWAERDAWAEWAERDAWDAWAARAARDAFTIASADVLVALLAGTTVPA